MRKCSVCGLPVFEGMTDNDSSFYCHEECFEKYMDDTYGKHHWMKLGGGAEDEYGGYYIVTCNVNNGFVGTGIYYTEYDEEEDEC